MSRDFTENHKLKFELGNNNFKGVYSSQKSEEKRMKTG